MAEIQGSRSVTPIVLTEMLETLRIIDLDNQNSRTRYSLSQGELSLNPYCPDREVAGI